MDDRLGKLQKLILVYIGVNTKEQTYIKRRTLTSELSKLLDCEKTKKFCTSISQSVNLLSKRGLITKRGSYIGLNINGKNITRSIIEHIKSEYDGKINWDIIIKYYHRKEKDTFRYAKGCIEIINKYWDTYKSFCNDIKKFDIRKGDNICVMHIPANRKKVSFNNIEHPKAEKHKDITKKQTKKTNTRKTKWNIFVNNLSPESATPDNFKIYTALLKMFPEVPQKVEERKQELFKHYNMVREHHPNYPPLTDAEWKAYPESWKKIDDECNKLMKIQKNKDAFSEYLFEISHKKYPTIPKEIIQFAISKYQSDVEKTNSTFVS